MNSADDPISAAEAAGQTTLTEAASKRLLRDAGIQTTAFAVAVDAEEAVAAAEDIGFPVVLKTASPAVTHKSEWADGAGVAVGLESPAAVVQAATDIEAAARAQQIESQLLVEEMRDTSAGTEVIVGGLRDASFGPVVLVGLGGVFTELFDDTSHRLAPLSHTEARSAIESLRAETLLTGYRGTPPADIDALAEVVTATGDLLVEREAITEIDLNPVLVTAEGGVALDALVVLEPESGEKAHD